MVEQVGLGRPHLQDRVVQVGAGTVPDRLRRLSAGALATELAPKAAHFGDRICGPCGRVNQVHDGPVCREPDPFW